MTESDNEFATATLAGGCFWCLEAVYRELVGVRSVEPGYTGGHTPDPSYEQVCSGTTGHAEAVRIRYDPHAISYADLLRVFFSVHDPTTPNRQGPDAGPQYRSAVFYHPGQRAVAEAVMHEVDQAGLYDGALVTELQPAAAFYPAESYHRNYFANHPNEAYCRAVIAPKVAAFRRLHVERLRSSAAAGS